MTIKFSRYYNWKTAKFNTDAEPQQDQIGKILSNISRKAKREFKNKNIKPKL